MFKESGYNDGESPGWGAGYGGLYNVDGSSGILNDGIIYGSALDIYTINGESPEELDIGMQDILILIKLP